MAPKFTNRLISESSPYLRQHAHNPVDWYPWGDEALERANELDLPILVSIGYSACHWCHVMEHESFEDEEVAAYMNAHFVNIKIDREERPDLDHIYMDAVQAISGSGGWPLNVFLTKDKKPFYGGTYFPPKKAFNRASWKDILAFISGAWKNKREEILEQAEVLLKHINDSGNHLLKNLSINATEEDKEFTSADCRLIAENILAKADFNLGGFGAAPKFPQTFTIQYLLMYGHFFNDEKAVHHASFSLKQMLNGGIYDHLAGGMARYSTDNEWLAPHFEKMLYDNALLVNVLSDAYQVTQDDFFRKGIIKTLDFITSGMKAPGGGFYAALDADTEGVEGRFYVWDKTEIEDVLQEDAALFNEWYGVMEHGNWEEKNILHVHTDLLRFSEQKGITVEALESRINKANEHMLAARNSRVHPSIDDKILLGWNALLLTALCKGYAALQVDAYKEEAMSLFDFISAKFRNKVGGYYHTYKNGDARYPAFLDDYAYLIQAYIFLQEITGEQQYLVEANEIMGYVVENFADKETGMFCFTHKDQKDVLVRKTEIYDGAVPSGNSVMCENLFYLAVVFNKPAWMEMAQLMLAQLKSVVIKYPTSFGIWATCIIKQRIGIHEIVITGVEGRDVVAEILRMYLPNKVLQAAETPQNFPLFSGKKFEKQPWIYLCRQYQCGLPVRSVEVLKKEIIKENVNTILHNI